MSRTIGLSVFENFFNTDKPTIQLILVMEGEMLAGIPYSFGELMRGLERVCLDDVSSFLDDIMKTLCQVFEFLMDVFGVMLKKGEYYPCV